MIITRAQLHCDYPGCPKHFPEDGAFDGAVHTPAMMRDEAKEEGWSRGRGRMGGPVDLCPNHKRKAGSK